MTVHRRAYRVWAEERGDVRPSGLSDTEWDAVVAARGDLLAAEVADATERIVWASPAPTGFLEGLSMRRQAALAGREVVYDQWFGERDEA